MTPFPNPHPEILEQCSFAARVDVVDDDVRAVLRTMFLALEAGASTEAVSAPQVGHDLQILAVRHDDRYTFMINLMVFDEPDGTVRIFFSTADGEGADLVLGVEEGEVDVERALRAAHRWIDRRWLSEA
jgi:peptide deformylase